MISAKQTILPAKIRKADIPRVYKVAAPVYDFWATLSESKARQRCLELAQIRDGDAVLEVAVGTGLTFAEILKRNPSGCNEGIDLTPAMLERAASKAAQSGAKDYRLRLGDAYHLEFADDTFDLLLNNFMFDLLPEEDFPAILAEFKRVLRPNGRLVLANMTKGKHWYNGSWETIYRIDPTWFGGCRGVALLEHVRSAGFRDTDREYVSQCTFPAEIVYGIKP